VAEPTNDTAGTDCRSPGALPVSPFRGLNPHFGMLMGVDDFQLLQAYPRGKHWLHQAWQHGAGAIWGLGVRVEPDGRLVVGAGLGIDAVGRELHLDADACLDLAAWLAAHRDDADLAEHLEEQEDGSLIFDAHVVIRFRGCLERQVPALREPCAGDGAATAYSRVFETVELALVPGPAPTAPPDPSAADYRRLRALLGLAEADPEETEIGEALADIAALPPADRPAALVAALRRLAALDSAALAPPQPAGGGPACLFPSDEAAPSLPLAALAGLHLTPDGGGWIFSELTAVDQAVRPVVLPTRLLQELLCACTCNAAADPGGPRVLRDSVALAGTTLTLEVDRTLLAASVAPTAFAVLSFDEAGGWSEGVIDSAGYDEPTLTLTIELSAEPGGDRIRVIARGTGPTPLLGADAVPLAGAVGDPPGSRGDGRDFVHMFERSGS
jgi:hypothetical protein